jgi:thioredoxin
MEKSTRIFDVTDETFRAEVLDREGPVVVDFWAPWCAPCRSFGETLEQVIDRIPENLVVAKVDVDDNRETAGRYQVRSIPTLLFVQDGEVLGAFSGALPAHAILDVFTRFAEGEIEAA